jgi:outer membrane protein insertion porin family
MATRKPQEEENLLGTRAQRGGKRPFPGKARNLTPPLDSRIRAVVSALLLQFLAVTLLIASAVSMSDAQTVAESSAYKGWAVSSLEISGLEENLVSGLSKGLVLSGQAKLLGRRRPTFYPQLLLDDIERARLYLARHGYPYARVIPRFRRSGEDRRVGIILDIHTGPPVTIESVSVEGMPPTQERQADVSSAIRPGKRFSEENVILASATLESVLKHAGHAKADVETSIQKADSTRVRVRLQANPGSIYKFDKTTVDGASSDLVPLVKKTINLKEGALFSPATVREAEDYLRLLNLFGRIRLSTRESGPQTLNLHADLAERRPTTMEINLGYWTDDLIKFGARWYHRNLLRAGRGLELKGSFSRFAQKAGTAFNWPGAFGSRTWGLANLSFERQREESYNLESTELELAGTYRPTLTTSLRAGVSVSNVDFDVKTEEAEAFLEQGGLLTALSLGWTRDSSNDRLVPTRGAVNWAHVEWAPTGSLSESHYISLETGSTVYVALGKRTVAAGRLGLAVAEPLGDSKDLLPNKRFYAGGATSMRGFKRRKLGPLDDKQAPLGGEAKVEAAVELRFPIVWRFEGAVFVDTGQVWADSDRSSLDDMEVAVGPGLMLRTPIGPVRADLGYRLTDKEPTQPRSVYHVSIGHPF